MDPAPLTRTRVAKGLGINVGVFLCLSILLWYGRHGSLRAVAWSPIAPIYCGIVFLEARDWDMAIASLTVSLAIAAFVFRALQKPSVRAAILAHVALAAYWLWSFCLLGIGV